MTAPKEIEIKLELAPASLPRLKKIPLIRALEAPAKRATEVSVYFDTDKHALRKKGLMLRVRRIGDRYIQTIKATGNGGLFERDEWESEIPSELPDLGLAHGTALEPLISNKFRRQLRPMFETRVTRTVYPLTNGTSTRDGFKTIGRACLKQIVGNEPALLEGDPEGVHQMRVGLRRLRAALSLFADILRDLRTAAIKTELKWLAGELAPARQLDVL